MLTLENPLNTVPSNIQNNPAIAQQSVQQSNLGPAIDRNAISRGQSRDSFTFSDDARRLAGQVEGEGDVTAQVVTDQNASASADETVARQRNSSGEQDSKESSAEREQASKSEDEASGTELTESERKQVEQLKDRDQEVRTHEQAHLSAAGSLANGGPKYDFQTGPDGRRYAVGGQVNIDNAPVSGDPQATIQKMTRVKAAALAPAEPSSQDRRVASDADRKKAQAQQELTQEQLESSQQNTPAGASKDTAPVSGVSNKDAAPSTNVGGGAATNDGPANLQQRTRGLASAYGPSGITANQQQQGLGLSIVA